MATKEEVKEPRVAALDEYRYLGNSGLKVSPLCLGCMTFGEAWDIGTGKDEAKKVFDLYRSKGGNFYDTANVYQNGDSEKMLGEFLTGIRSEAVIATKYTGNMKFSLRMRGKLAPDERINVNGGGNSRKSMVENLDDSLKRLGVGHVDLFYVHNWDFSTPVNEVMRGLDDCVRSGKALYVGVSDVPAWVVAKANVTAELKGWTPFVGLQTRYNLIERSLEGELGPMALDCGLGIIPWGILAEGFLTGKHKKGEKMATSGRNESVSRHFAVEKNEKILEEVLKIAEETKKTPSQIATNWMMNRPITSALVGAKTEAQLKENIEALEFKLTKEQLDRLNAASAPQLPFPQVWGKLSNFNNPGLTVLSKLPVTEF